MARLWAVSGFVAATSIVGTVAIAATFSAPGENDSAATGAQARSVAVEFFRSQNERRYDDTCRLLSRGFYRTHALRDRQTCSAVMRVAFVWSGKIVFRIGTVEREGDWIVVRAVADGAPGRIVFVREGGALRILAVRAGSDARRRNLDLQGQGDQVSDSVGPRIGSELFGYRVEALLGGAVRAGSSSPVRTAVNVLST